MVLKNKVANMQEAISQYVNDGDRLIFSGFVTNRKPYAAVREIIKQGKKNLYIESPSGGGDVDMLIGAGSVKVLVNSYVANAGFTQVGRRFKKFVQEKDLLLEDYSLDVLAILYHAAALGQPFVALKNMLGSDLADKWGISQEVRDSDPKLKLPKLLIEKNPFDDKDKLCYIPTPKIDTAIIHVQKAAPDGTARIEGSVFSDIDAAMAATNCILTCEELVHPDELRKEPWHNQFPNILVDAVVHVPYGAHPSQCANYYDLDAAFLRLYDKASSTDDFFDQYLDEWIFSLKNHSAYLDKLGAQRLSELRVIPGYGYVPRQKGVF